jgi:hypothetical protein
VADYGDGYDAYYANRLWQLLPGVYRAQDGETTGSTGPLQELVNRIGAQVAVVRRSIDRLWADQSIETCDDWVIPYLGALLDTNLLGGLDPAGRRLDVANTIHYRRRKGTPAILEEVGRDVTGWQTSVVESFRRLSRTRHTLDPPVGVSVPAGTLGAAPGSTPGLDEQAWDLLRHEGLVGTLTSTRAGGLADLRSVHGAALAGSPFDEFAHTADLRAGRGAVGHYAIGTLLVCVWRLEAFTVPGATPVAVTGCPNVFTFDPTGRQIPLFTAPLAPKDPDFADLWTAARETEVPGPLTDSLQVALSTAHYPGAAAIAPFATAQAGPGGTPVAITITPQVGQFSVSSPSSEIAVSYQYGFPATVGAGPYDRTLLPDPPAPTGTLRAISGGSGLDAALTAAGGAGTVQIGDSLTYGAVSDPGPVTALLVAAGDRQRPVIRLPGPAAAGDPPATWTITAAAGAPAAAAPSLTLDGLLVSGGDIVLRGAFAGVRLTGFTADPGTAAPGSPGGYAAAVDGRALAPTTIWIEADPAATAGTVSAIASLEIDNCVLGPVRTRNGGAVLDVAVSDSIVQAVAPAPAAATTLSAADVYDPALLATVLAGQWPPARQIFQALPATAQQAITAATTAATAATSLPAILDGLNGLIAGSGRLDTVAPALASVPIAPDLAAALAGGSADVAAVNRSLLAAAFPAALAPAALAFTAGALSLRRVTVIGPAYAHSLTAADSIVTGFTVAQDAQAGYVRYSAVSRGSYTPRQFNCAALTPGASLFTSTDFGQPGYGQLLETVDRGIATAPRGVTISHGAENGSEMGAYCSALAPIKESGLLIKFGEYMPLGLTPVIVHVT